MNAWTKRQGAISPRVPPGEARARIDSGLDPIRWAEAYLQDRGILSPAHDARRLAALALSVPVGSVPFLEKGMSSDQLGRFRNLVERRGTREPLQYIEGSVDFFGVTLKVRPPVLVPRQETEILVEAVLPLVESPLLDAGTGSGCILLGLLARDSKLVGEGWDCSEDAVTLARENARLLGLDQRAAVRKADLLRENPARPFTTMVANPPYVARPELGGLPAEVSRYEDRRALDGGPTGLEFIHSLIDRADHLVEPGGLVALEVGAGQAGAVESHLEDRGYREIRIVLDLAGIERVVMGRRRIRSG